MSSKVKSLSSLVNDQLPKFISAEYPKFSVFLQKYYEQLELPGQPIDLISNLTKYHDIDTYEKSVLKENTVTIQTVDILSTIIYVEDTVGFPENNGYILIDDEVIFYRSKTQTSFNNCYRNVSSVTKLGDLYSASTVKNVEYSDVGTGIQHYTGTSVLNISNLFLYAFVKSFESQYLGSFPENSLKPEVNKNLLIKNIKKFYASKGTEQSIKFIFNSIVSKEVGDIPLVYYPKDSTIKSSSGEWISNYSLKVKVLSGDPKKLIGEKIIQGSDKNDGTIKNAFAYIDNVLQIGDNLYEIILSRESIVGQFNVVSKTNITKTLFNSSNSGKKINVYSTAGWSLQSGYVIVGNELISYSAKNINQFTIGQRGSFPISYAVGTDVYSYSNVYGEYIENGQTNKIQFIVLGILYSLDSDNKKPYSSPGDIVQSSKSGFETTNKILFNKFSGNIRWRINETFVSPSFLSPTISNQLADTIADVSAIFEDEQYYYITSSGFPSHAAGNLTWNTILSDQKHLKIIRKYPTTTTEIYKTTTKDVGILVNGTVVKSYKDEEEITFGKIIDIEVTNQGAGYQAPPYVLITDSTGTTGVATARAVLAGEVVEKIIVDSSNAGFFPPVPDVEIVSGRNAVVEAVVTGDKVTILKIINPGEYYSSPPKITIRDSTGKGRFASFTALITNDGKLSGFIKNQEGKFYTQENISVVVSPVGSGATAISKVNTWVKNRFEKFKDNLDSSYGYYFLNNKISIGYGYYYLANPKSLRIQLNDNIDSVGNIPNVLQHSPIIGYAYDGNPIYGPYGYSQNLNSSSTITRITSSYIKKLARVDGPSTILYPMGSFVEDYDYVHESGKLDQNNGRYCVTPEYPEGTYAYFVTINANNNPVFPYIVGENYYSLPVDSNYNKEISQDDLPKNISRLRTPSMQENGFDVLSYVESVNSGSVDNVTIDYSTPTFTVGSVVEAENLNSDTSKISSVVSSITGKSVSSIKSSIRTQASISYDISVLTRLNQKIGYSNTIGTRLGSFDLISFLFYTRSSSFPIAPLTIDDAGVNCIKLTTKTPVYLFEGDLITQANTNSVGKVVGNVINGNTVYLEDITSSFSTDAFDTITSQTNVISLIVNKSSLYSKDADIILTNGKQVIIRYVSANKIRVSSNPFVNGEPIVFSNSFSSIVAGTIYYVVNSENNAFTISSTQNGTPINLSSNNNPSAVASSEKSRAIILESTENSNTITVKVTRGTFSVDSSFYLQSFAITDTIGNKIDQITNLSSNITLLSIKNNISIVSTTEPHKLSVNDKVNIDIFPNDAITETNIFVRKRIYQTVKLNTPSYTKTINDSGIGRLLILNSGADYVTNAIGTSVYTNVELIFANQSLCRNDAGQNVSSSSPLATIGKIGNSNNAKATFVVTNGLVTSVTITSKGKNYKKGDILTVTASSLLRLGSSTSTAFFTCVVDHVGFGLQENTLFLNDLNFISIGDYLQIDNEIVLVNTINYNNISVQVSRAQKNTVAVDHFDNKLIVNESPSYQFIQNYKIGLTNADAFVSSYDRDRQELTVFFDTSRTLDNINSLNVGFSFFDSSSPKKLVRVTSIIENYSYKFEFSYDNINFLRNPIVFAQKHYKYKFDTSHSSLLGSFLQFSPSGNFNIITSESKSSDIAPGNINSFTSLKFGFGPNIASNLFNKKQDTNFSNYYYYDKNNIIDSDKSYLKLIDDSLQGNHSVTYVTPTRFVYEPNNLPQYAGSGNIFYSTNSSSALGSIKTISVINGGSNSQQLPPIIGVRPGLDNECLADVQWNSISKNITGITIINPGKDYSKPKAILIDGDGILAEFLVNKTADNKIGAITVVNSGRNYSYKPSIKIIETDVKLYYSSTTIGTPNKITLLQNGNNFNSDSSISKIFTTPRILILKNFSADSFFESEIIEQYDNSVLIASAVVSKGGWTGKTNILKVEKVSGEFQPNLQIVGKIQNKTALVVSTFVTLFSPNVKSYYDNIGYYASDVSKLNSASQKLTDSYFYQDYSYVIKSKTPIDVWRDLIKETIHPAGFKLFGEVTIEKTVDNSIKSVQPNVQYVSVIQLWDPQKNKISVEKTYKTITQTQVKVSDYNVQKGVGSVFLNSFDDAETISYEIYLYPEFNGYISPNGTRSGNKTFNIKILGSSVDLSVENQQNAIISLDGILQEPENSFTISGSQITFKEAPLGYRNFSGNSIPSSSYKEGVDTPSQKFLGKVLRFKNTTLNTKYFKKIKNISSEFNGIKTVFELKNYFDNSNIALDLKENLLVSIDGVLQKSGVTPIIPINRSYYIRKNVIPNELVFLDPPKAGQSFFAQSISNYEKVKIDQFLVDGERKGPFVMKSVLNNKTLEVFNDKNIIVFIDGVFQKKNISYEVRGSSITFSEPLKIGQDVNILYFYGRDESTIVTAFNYDASKFFNLIKINLNTIPAIQQYADKVIYQGNSLLDYYSIGKCKSISVTGVNTSTLIVLSQNKLFNNFTDLTIKDGLASNLGDLVIPFANIVSITEVLKDEDSNHILTQDNSGWLIGSELRKKSINTFDVGDKIKINGEKNFRDIIFTDDKAYKLNYNTDTFIESKYYNKLKVSPNDEISFGEGLVVYANLENGRIVSLEWNDRKYGTYGLSKIQPGAYTYDDAPKLIFVPEALRNEGGTIISPPRGGGAEAFVIVSNGEVIDVVLTNSGSNYLTPPKIVVTRGYDIIKKAEKKVDTLLTIGFSPKIQSNIVVSSIVNLEYGFAVHNAESIITRVAELEPSRVITTIFPAFPVLNNILSIPSIPINISLNLQGNINSISSTHREISSSISPTFNIVPISTVASSSNELNKYIEGGVIDNFADNTLQSPISYVTNILGARLSTFESGAFISGGVGNVSGITLEQFNRTYENITIQDFTLRSNSRKGLTETSLMNLAYKSITEYGAYLDIGLSAAALGGYDDITGFLGQDNLVLTNGTYTITVNVALNGVVTLVSADVGAPSGLYITPGGTRFIYDIGAADTIIYIPNTSRFPQQGKLSIGKEIVYYTSKLSDRFFGVTRGAENTTIQPHAAGDYLRSVL